MNVARRFRGIVAVSLLLTSISTAQAKYSGGTGEPNDPYQIATAADLIALGETPADDDKHFVLTADIDLDPNLPGRKVFDKAVIGTLTGVFDGNGHTISHLTVEGGGHLGLFGELRIGAEVRDLGVADVNITASNDYTGALVGANGGTLTGCYSTGVVRGREDVGGLVGDNWGPAAQCYSACAVSGGNGVGGLMGENSNGTVKNCYSTGPVRGTGWDGGLMAYNNGAVVHCFWDTQSSGQTTSAGGTGKTTGEMQIASTFLDAGWDFVGETANGSEDIWKIAEGLGYPRLSWEKYSGGTGEPNDPYQIATAADLIALGETPEDYDKHFILTADIDLDPNLPGRKVFDKAVIAPVSRVDVYPYVEGTPFTGVFDGNGHTIWHLTMKGGSCVGLFGQLGEWPPVGESEVRDIGVVDFNIAGSGTYVGGLVGYNSGGVSQCHSTGTVSWTGPFNAWPGGVGGLVGYNAGHRGAYYGRVTRCYSTGAVSGVDGVGGLVGHNDGFVGESYSATVVTSAGYVGGLAGQLWSAIAHGGYVRASFWDAQTSGQTHSYGGIGKTTAEMQMAKTFLDAGWDFVGETRNGTEDTWCILEGRDYPRFVWQFRVSSPNPADGATDIVQSPVLSWYHATKSTGHDVYFGENEEIVMNATPETPGIYGGRQPLGVTTYDPGVLECGKTYYWRIDEVNPDEPNSPWKGRVWSFSTSDLPVATVIDDFESYTDDEDRRIDETWIDGWTNDNGSTVGNIFGNWDHPIPEQKIVHGGRQSMPMDYDNRWPPWYSEAERTWGSPQDWMIDGADTLTLYFRGEAGNSSEPLYVGIEDSGGRMAVVVHPDAEAVLASGWQKWHIALGEVRAAGVDVAAVKKMVIGVGDRKNPKPGGTGRIYIDDIRLTKRMP